MSARFHHDGPMNVHWFENNIERGGEKNSLNGIIETTQKGKLTYGQTGITLK